MKQVMLLVYHYSICLYPGSAFRINNKQVVSLEPGTNRQVIDSPIEDPAMVPMPFSAFMMRSDDK